MITSTRKKITQSKGSSSLEYLVVVAAVISVLVIFLGQNGIFYKALSATLETTTNGMTDMASRMAQSRGAGTESETGGSTLPGNEPF